MPAGKRTNVTNQAAVDLRHWQAGLTAGDRVPGPPVDDVVVLLEVLVVAVAAVGVGHHQVGGGVDGGQPAEESVVRRGGVLLRGPVAGAVVGVGDHQLPPVEVGAEHEGNLLHPVDDGARLRGDLSGHGAFYSFYFFFPYSKHFSYNVGMQRQGVVCFRFAAAPESLGWPFPCGFQFILYH